MRSLLPIVAAFGVLFTGSVSAAIEVIIGPTPIPRGDAQGENDLTVKNGIFAVAFTVDTPSPWGVARGGIVDIAFIRNGEIGYDIASLADFMPNNWSAWPTSYQRVSVTEQTNDEVVVRTERDWGSVELSTEFRIRANDTRIEMRTTMNNKGSEALNDLLTGYVLWPDGGYLFGMPGLAGLRQGDEADALGRWSAAYDQNWVLGLHAPFASVANDYGRDRYLAHSLGAGERRQFDAVLQILGQGDLSQLVQEEINASAVPSGTLHGEVRDINGELVGSPAVIVSQDGRLFVWAVGRDGKYSVSLPAGAYEFHATARSYSKSTSQSLVISAGDEIEHNFEGLKPPGSLGVTVIDKQTREPLDARIGIESGPRSPIQFYGQSTYFTELNAIGLARVEVAPGQYRLRVSAGGGFSSMPQFHDVTIESNEEATLLAEIEVTARPAAMGWYSADLHHHSDVLDGFTEPEFVLRSELASGTDLSFLSDHDSMANNAELGRLSAQRGVTFIPGVELSPSWAHFNAYPVDADAEIAIDIGSATVQQVFDEALRLGADVVHVNHPYGNYGYFHALQLQIEVDEQLQSAVPGGYDDRFDVIEMTAAVDNSKTLRHAWELWNAGKRAYLVAGSDAHNVWVQESGSARTYAYVEGELTADNFVQAVLRGNAFASQGPLIFPELAFGRDIDHAPGADLTLNYQLQAAAGSKSVSVIEQGEVRLKVPLDGGTDLESFEFTMQPDSDTWYSLLLEDQDGRKAWSNPVWIHVQEN